MADGHAFARTEWCRRRCRGEHAAMIPWIKKHAQGTWCSWYWHPLCSDAYFCTVMGAEFTFSQLKHTDNASLEHMPRYSMA